MSRGSSGALSVALVVFAFAAAACDGSTGGGGGVASRSSTVPPTSSSTSSAPVPAGVRDVVDAGLAPCAATAAQGSFWVTLNGSDSIAEIDPATDRVVHTYAIPDDVCGIGYANGDLWIAGVNGGDVSRFDLATRRVIQRVALTAPLWDLQAGASGVWVAGRGGEVWRIDAATGKVAARLRVGGVLGGLAVTPGAVWVADTVGDRVVRIDPASDRVAGVTSTPGFSPTWFAADGPSLWVSSATDGRALRLDPASGHVAGSVRIPGGPLDGDVVDGRLWMPCTSTGVLWELNATTGATIRRLQLGKGIFVAQGAAGGLWVLNFSDVQIYRVDG